jgi:hypothetical protein
MAFTLPTFNLSVNVWHRPHLPPADPPDLTIMGNLSRGRRVTTLDNGGFAAASDIIMQLLVPKGTDLRDTSQNVDPDVVEAPAGSGRFYLAGQVDDSGKGFANEYRWAMLTKTFGPLVPDWPIPMP